jgi:transposase-like protein
MGQLSNQDRRSRIRQLHAVVQGQRAGGATEHLAVPGPSERHQRQIQHGLPVDEGEQLVRDYLAEAKVRDLAVRYQVDRNTVIGHVNRAGVRRHYPALLPEVTPEASQLYRSGRSLAAVGGHFGVNASTVRTSLLRIGVPMWDSQGREL